MLKANLLLWLVIANYPKNMEKNFKDFQNKKKSENHCLFRENLLRLDSVLKKEVKYHYGQLVHIKNLHLSFTNFCHRNFERSLQ